MAVENDDKLVNLAGLKEVLDNYGGIVQTADFTSALENCVEANTEIASATILNTPTGKAYVGKISSSVAEAANIGNMEVFVINYGIDDTKVIQFFIPIDKQLMDGVIYRIYSSGSWSTTRQLPSTDASGAIPTYKGGTGLTSVPSMLTNLGSTTAENIFAASPRPGVTGTLPVGNGGTGATTAEAARTALGVPTLKTVSGVDIDTLTEAGFYMVSNGTSTATGESNINAFLFVASNGSGRSCQIKIGTGGLSLSYRTYSSGTWIDWVVCMEKTALPISRGGTGSTTAADARTALGITPANIGATPAAIGAVAKTGDTMTGALNLNPPVIADANEAVDGVTYMMRTDSTSLNTPSKQGITDSEVGLLISTRYGRYGTQMYLGNSRDIIYVRRLSGGTWYAWEKLSGPDQRVTYDMTVNVTNATVGTRCYSNSYTLPSGVTKDTIKGIFTSKNSASGSANVNSSIGSDGKLYVSVYAASASVSASISVTVVY